MVTNLFCQTLELWLCSWIPFRSDHDKMIHYESDCTCTVIRDHFIVDLLIISHLYCISYHVDSNGCTKSHTTNLSFFWVTLQLMFESDKLIKLMADYHHGKPNI